MTHIQAFNHYRRPSGHYGAPRLQTDTSMDLWLSNGHHVMLVQRRAIELQVMVEMLNVLGYRVTTAKDCGKALLRFSREPCEVVICELDMPDFNGFQLAQLIRKHSPRTHILLMTACCQAEVVDYMDRGVVDGWLFKPFRIDAINDMLKGLFDSE